MDSIYKYKILLDGLYTKNPKYNLNYIQDLQEVYPTKYIDSLRKMINRELMEPEEIDELLSVITEYNPNEIFLYGGEYNTDSSQYYAEFVFKLLGSYYDTELTYTKNNKFNLIKYVVNQLDYQ